MSRLDRHARVSAALAAASSDALNALVGATSTVGVGGGSTTVEVAGARVFAKRVPLTDLELAHPHSTANLFDLPMTCNYGIGSPGFTAWRELAANTLVTESVLAGEAESFPLLHDWRILPGRAPIAPEYADVTAAAAVFGGSPSVRARLEALAAATHSLVLFTEHIPTPMGDWLADSPAAKAESVERQLMETTAFLRDRDLLHLDAHFANMRVAADRIYLTDWGLALSPHFDLTPAEHAFFQANTNHDTDYASMRLVNWLVTSTCALPPTDIPTRNAYVEQCANGHIPPDVPAHLAAIVTRHAPAAARMNALYWNLFSGDFTAVTR